MAHAAVGIAKITQRGATCRDGLTQHPPHGRQQAGGTLRANAVAGGSRVDAGLKQRVAGVNVARAHNQVARQQGLLDRQVPGLQAGMKVCCGVVQIERLAPQPRQ